MTSRTLGYVTAIWIVGLLFVPGAAWAQATPPDKAPGGGILPPAIPIFPLPDVTLFPNLSLPLNIFEPRYRAMVTDALKGDRIIGMVQLRPGYEADYEGRPPVYLVGCAGVITDVESLPDGRFNIVLRGLVKFRITGEDQSRAYRVAQVEPMPESPSIEERTALRSLRPRLALLAASFAPGSDPLPPTVPDEEFVNALAQYLEIDPMDRQGLLERNGALSRAQGLLDLLETRVTPVR